MDFESKLSTLRERIVGLHRGLRADDFVRLAEKELTDAVPIAVDPALEEPNLQEIADQPGFYLFRIKPKRASRDWIENFRNA